MSFLARTSQLLLTRNCFLVPLSRSFSDASASASASASAPRSAPASVKSKDPLHISYEVQENVAIIRLNSKDSKVNVLSQEFLSELQSAFSRFQSDSSASSAVIISSKADNFIAGADIGMISSAKTPNEVEAISTTGQIALNAVAASSKPVVAAINGSCLGGGLELTLACHYRIASESASTVLGLPEVQLGLLPAAGGTQRLPKLVGLPAALDMTLTGKQIRPAHRALKMGLVDQVADVNALLPAAIQAAKGLASQQLIPKRNKSVVDRILQSFAPARKFVFKKAEENVDKQTGGESHYPAPYAILSAVKKGIEDGFHKGSHEEASKFGLLAFTPQSKALRGLFFAQTALKKNRFGKPSSSTSNILVLGAGLMGGGIAQVSAERSYKVLLYDRDLPSLARGQKQIWSNLDASTKKKKYVPFERDLIFSRIVPLTPDSASLGRHLATTDLVIEAVPEDLGLKQKLLSGLEDSLPSHAVIASNTSALPISQIAKALKRPERVVGMHYFSPVDKMPLLEIITTDKTSNEAAAVAVDVGIKQGKTVIVVKDGPGFYTTRILTPMMAEVIALLGEGIGVLDLEKIIKKAGFPVGPVTLIDEVGVDVGKHVSEELAEAFGERMGNQAGIQTLDKLIKAGFLGRKTGKGFFLYEDDKKQGVVQRVMSSLGLGGKHSSKRPINEAALQIAKVSLNSSSGAISETDVRDRVILRFVNEAVLCLQEQILASPADGDIGAVFGLGFPPFLGGPFRYIDQVGAANVVSTLLRYQKAYGDRFQPAELLKEYAASGKLFHQN